MSELRQDPTTKDWAIISTERSKRPHQFAPDGQLEAEIPAFDEKCPFCPGNEAQTPPEIMRISSTEGSDSAPWQVRVVPNKFSALSLGRGTITRRLSGELFLSLDGMGVHEVIVETSRHNARLCLMEVPEVERLLSAYRSRYNALKTHPYIRFIIIFRNYGVRAGTSLEHPHSQLVGTPVAPPYIRRKFQVATSYYDDMGRCLYCHVFRDERDTGDRIVLETDEFLVFHPFASRYPFETWIAPKKHCSSFGLITESQLSELAWVLKRYLSKMHSLLKAPHYNLMVNTSPTENEENPYYDWHIIIIPRLTMIAGFEIGTGISINTALPEETARFLRQSDTLVPIP
ncbi:MAG: galactose-1-phosphate uridylyltransferase [Chloroflexi bacterium]|nr:galactose-1-phosphate uridylyltransferase [Chloroflexota bacterium]